MANIHRIGDYQNDNNARRAPLLARAQPNAIPFTPTVRQGGDPRKEGPGDMLKYFCCPSLRLKSFTVIITIIDVAIYIGSLIYGYIIMTPGWLHDAHPQFLSPYPDALDTLGSRIPYKIYQHYQIYRFITPVFLHANFLHIFFNAFSQLILGSQIEVMLGTVRTIIVYFICAAGGNLIGCLLAPNDSAVGASTAIVGFLGVFIAFVILNWKRLDPQIRCFMVCMIVFIIIFNLLFSLGGNAGKGSTDPVILPSEVDQWGHLGGLITGITAGMFLLTPMGGSPGTYEAKVKNVGIGLTAFYFVLGLCLFYLVTKPRSIF